MAKIRSSILYSRHWVPHHSCLPLSGLPWSVDVCFSRSFKLFVEFWVIFAKCSAGEVTFSTLCKVVFHSVPSLANLTPSALAFYLAWNDKNSFKVLSCLEFIQTKSGNWNLFSHLIGSNHVLYHTCSHSNCLLQLLGDGCRPNSLGVRQGHRVSA